jgi:23S rRNA (guanosine2251-2'-O)-methyltransferase
LKKLKLEELHRASLDEYRSKPKVPVTIVLDSIRSAMNVGSIFRTADAFCVERIMICGYTATPPHKEITKTAIGATESVAWEYIESIETALTQLKAQQYTIIGIEQTNTSVPLHDYNINIEARYALVLGNEVDGISDEVLPLLDGAIEIPQYGTKHSLNVSVCGGIVIYYFCMPWLQG